MELVSDRVLFLVTSKIYLLRTPDILFDDLILYVVFPNDLTPVTLESSPFLVPSFILVKVSRLSVNYVPEIFPHCLLLSKVYSIIVLVSGLFVP